jgi:hypothetical protein
MAQYRRGAEAIAAASSSGGGNFAPFVPELYWKDADEKKYILVLTPIDEVGAFDLQDFIPIPAEKANGEEYTRYESFLSRKDPYIGEDFDKIEDELDRKSRVRCIGVAVELEPVIKDVKGRKRPVEFAVKTDTFDRKTEEGEEEVEYPLIGLISQSSKLMWSPLFGMDESQGPLSELALQVTRRIPNGKKSDTSYEFVPFPEIPINLTPVVDHLEGISYLSDTLEELLPQLEATETDLEAAQVIAKALFDRRVEELADPARYDELLGDIDELEPPPWGGGGKKTQKKRTVGKRAARPSQRRVKQEDPEETPEAEADTAETEETTEDKPDRFAKLKARVETND